MNTSNEAKLRALRYFERVGMSPEQAKAAIEKAINFSKKHRYYSLGLGRQGIAVPHDGAPAFIADFDEATFEKLTGEKARMEFGSNWRRRGGEEYIEGRCQEILWLFLSDPEIAADWEDAVLRMEEQIEYLTSASSIFDYDRWSVERFGKWRTPNENDLRQRRILPDASTFKSLIRPSMTTDEVWSALAQAGVLWNGGLNFHAYDLDASLVDDRRGEHILTADEVLANADALKHVLAKSMQDELDARVCALKRYAQKPYGQHGGYVIANYDGEKEAGVGRFSSLMSQAGSLEPQDATIITVLAPRATYRPRR